MRRGGISMVRLQRIVRDYQEAGSVNSLLALWGFVDQETFLTKAGHVGVVFRLAGVDDECLDEAERRDVVHRFEAALRVLDEHCRVYQYLYKHRIDPIEAAVCDDPVVHDAIQQRVAFLNNHRGELYEVELYLVLVYEGMPSGDDVARIRGYTHQLQRAIGALEGDVLSRQPRYHEMTAILDKVAAGALIGRRQDMATNQLLAHTVEQLLARAKRLRDTEAATMNMRLGAIRDGRVAGTSLVRGAADDLRTWRQP